MRSVWLWLLGEKCERQRFSPVGNKNKSACINITRYWQVA